MNYTNFYQFLQKETNQKATTELIDLQNPALDVPRWWHLKTEGDQGRWTLMFLIAKEDADQLAEG